MFLLPSVRLSVSHTQYYSYCKTGCVTGCAPEYAKGSQEEGKTHSMIFLYTQGLHTGFWPMIIQM